MWFNGNIVSTGHDRGKQVFKVHFRYRRLHFEGNRYGSAKLSQAYGSKPAQVTPGRMFLAPVAAETDAAEPQRSDGGSALESPQQVTVTAAAWHVSRYLKRTKNFSRLCSFPIAVALILSRSSN